MTFPDFSTVALWLLLLLLALWLTEALSQQLRQRDAARRAQQERQRDAARRAQQERQRALKATSLWAQKPVTVRPLGRRPHGVHSAPSPGGGTEGGSD